MGWDGSPPFDDYLHRSLLLLLWSARGKHSGYQIAMRRNRIPFPAAPPSIPSSSEVARSTQSFVCDGNCFLDLSTHGSVTKDGIIGDGDVDIITAAARSRKSSKSGSEAINL